MRVLRKLVEIQKLKPNECQMSVRDSTGQENNPINFKCRLIITSALGKRHN